MTNGKVKITREQEKAFEHLLKSYSKEEIIDSHAIKMNVGQGKGWNAAINQPLNDLPQADLARALLIGYDVEPKFKKGEYVVDSAGNIGKVSRVENRRVWGHWNNGSSIEQFSEESTTRHATPEEIKAEKERRLWDKIGRKVGEFKIGDVGMFENGETLKVKSYIDVKGIEIMYRDRTLEGFYPAESFVSFEEGEEE